MAANPPITANTRKNLNMRVGIGYDLHRLEKGRKFILGGEVINADFGPLGHSDGDALTHAIIDALLGALGLGDIGSWFPDTDKTYKDACSIKLLKKIMKEVRLRGWEIGNLDTVIILERPKLAPNINKIRAGLAGALGIDQSLVSIKAKTNEGCGEIGEEKAIAAHAIVLLAPYN